MNIACLWTPDWRTDEEPPAPAVPPDVVRALLEIVPRVALDARGPIWADVRGLPTRQTARRLKDAAGASTRDGSTTSGDAATAPCVGVADVPAAAEVAARWKPRDGIAVVPAGADRAFLAGAPIALLEPPPSLLSLLEGTGLLTCGSLAALSRESVEVRLGTEGGRLWRLSRADDPRRLFDRIAPLRPHASIDFVEYVITDPARLVFAANALITPICQELAERGEHARSMTLTLPLANGRAWSRALRPGRPTASRDIWLRLVRSRLERLSVPDAVIGVAVEVGSTEPAGVRQGDLFDRGFGSAGAVEAALSRLVGELGEVVVAPDNDAHPLAERRTSWRVRDPIEIADNRDRSEPGAPDRAVPGASADAPLTLQLLPDPRPVRVELEAGRPSRYHDRSGWRALRVVAGPDRISGGWWEEAYAREYYRCVDEDGVLVWIYRDAGRDLWLLQGWWD
ncbi:MAG: hypothetical protein ABFS34_00600 [Gemmatimonadota bacterium]